MTHHSHYHPSDLDTLTLLQDSGDPDGYTDLIGQSCEDEEENIFAELLGYEPETSY
jgi:hypothetical protein